MKSIQIAVLLFGATLILGGCGAKEEAAPTASPSPAAKASPAPAAPPATTLKEVPSPEFANATVKDAKATPAAPVGGLRKSTDPTARLKVAESHIGRPDPFGINPIKVTVTLPVVKPSLKPSISLPSLPNSSTSSLPSLPTSLPPNTNSTYSTTVNPPKLVPTLTFPDPALAKAVTVTGIVQVGSSRQAIIRSPLEPSSRYVSAGQRIANGQVLVKRIETRGSEPVVVLEQLGIEVIRFVGQQPEVPAQSSPLPVPNA